MNVVMLAAGVVMMAVAVMMNLASRRESDPRRK